MKKLALAVVVMAALVAVAAAQETKAVPSKTVVGAGFARGIHASETRGATAPPTNLFFCPSGQCLYYSGDLDCKSPNMNGLFDFDNPGIGISDAEVWVGVKPTQGAIITGASGNYFTMATGIGINPTPFAVRTGISPGKGGKIVCSTHGNAVIHYYGDSCGIGINSINYFVAKIARACQVKAGKTYYIDLTPQYNDGSTIGYLEDDDGRQLNHQGWPNLRDKSYFNSTSFEVSYEPTWGSGGACGGIGCDGFSISLTGKQY
jgi:hypothetical protein